MSEENAAKTSSTTQNGDLDKETTRPSNERLLCTAFISFMGFSIAQTIAAVVAGSEALTGDSAAMMVDALTYLFNWYAERKKHSHADNLKQKPTGRAVLEYRKYAYQLELVPPLLSVSTLLVVTGVVLNKAIHVLILDSKRDVSEQADPNVHLMMLFSFLNLLLDFLNVFCFAKAKHALGYQTNPNERADDEDRHQVKTMRYLLDYDEGASRDGNDLSLNDKDYNEVAQNKTAMKPMEIEDPKSDHAHADETNLNMCSAYTHVFADTLRSIAVIIAASLAEFTPAITSEEADAAAAVVVSVLIALSLIPLFSGMVKTFGALKRVNALLAEEELESGDNECEEDEEGNWV